MAYIDLHTHSTFSDGTLTPTELVGLAAEKGLAAIALTDHDTISGVPEAIEAAKALVGRVRVIPGVEISAGFRDRDIHILGLNIDINSKSLNASLDAARANRMDRNMRMLKRFQEAGYKIELSDLTSDPESKEATFTRGNFARALAEKGYAKDVTTAFNRFLAIGSPFYIPREFVSREETIKIILDAGGIPILAHPLLYDLKHKEVEALVDELIGYGLQGIEAIYSAYTGDEEQYVKSLAHRKGLKVSGGSDFHGANKPYLTLGSGRGNLKIQESILDELLS